ncbi:unnamed protein product [Peniophora sp. CBMAI 1063]|nr:unnamed protein product [Peniophora sp. CBMAI 1063]
MDMDQTQPPTREAGPPFAEPDADLILRTSDGVNFRMHRLLLAKCSPVFADILSLPAPPSTEPALMEVAETERAIRFLLDYCYWRLPNVLRPKEAAEFAPDALEDLQIALHLSDKYHVDEMHALAIRALSTLSQTKPVQVYAIAWTQRNRPLLLQAARASLSQPFTEDIPNIPEFENVPGTAVLRLFQYQQQCKIAAVKAATHSDWLDDEIFPGAYIEPDYEDWDGTYEHICSSPLACPNEKARMQLWANDGRWQWALLPWLYTYFTSARGALRKCARGSSVEAYDVMYPALKAASVELECISNSCAEQALRVVPRMAKLLSAQVEKVIDEVHLETPF